MHRHIAIKSIGRHWPSIFTVGVIVFFALTALGVGNLMSIGDDSTSYSPVSPTSPGASAGTVETTAQGTSSGAFDLTVKSLRSEPASTSNGTMVLDATLEVRNNAKANADFYPARVSVRRTSGGIAKAPKDAKAEASTVSNRVSQIVPLSFEVKSATGISYSIIYGGKTIYSGIPTTS